ncbi:TPR end-of-group domain-containing protein [Crenothrix sp.]|uniref:TPR end-of-group domain-containing protein n=1 Tax=Crenothrix sp. TaxID=3100433 RepID=UPI00374D0292
MAQAATARCRNRVNCDLALRAELIEIPQDGRCPECRQPLQTEANSSGSATDEARRKRIRLIVLSGGAVSLCLAGLLVWGLQGTDAPAPEVTGMDIASMEASNIKQLEPPAGESPPPLPPVALEPVSTAPSLETQQDIKQGMVFVSLAKQNPKTRSENIQNALVEFDNAIKKEEAQGRCFAIAYMNRGVAYWQDKKLNLAEKDLLKASECDPKSPIVFYNLASYYAAINKTDLALEPLDKALDLGFKDCDVLRKDSDLKNLRKQKDFRRVLEKHSLFCLG